MGKIIYTPFEKDGSRKQFRSNEMTKGDLVSLYEILYSAYILEHSKNKELSKEVGTLYNQVMELEAKENAPISELFGESFSKKLGEFIDARVKEKLTLTECSEPYSGYYAELKYDGNTLGDSVTISSYPED